MNRKLDIFLSILLVIAVGVGAWYVFFTEKEVEYEEVDFGNTEVETELLKEYYIANAYAVECDYQNQDILDTIDATDAEYFNVMISGSDGLNSYYLWQLPKAEYQAVNDDTSTKGADSRALKITEDYFHKLFNFSYMRVEAVGENYTGNNSNVLDKTFKFATSNALGDLEEMFNYDVDGTFQEQELVLSCDEISFHKICSMNNEEGNDSFVEDGEMYYLIGNATVNVKTKDFEEIKNVKIKTLVSLISSGNDVNFQIIELIEQ